MAFPSVTYTKDNDAFAGLFSNAAEANLSLSGLGPMAAIASVAANLLKSDPSTVTVPAGDVDIGTFGANLTPAATGIYSFPSNVGIGNTGFANRALTVGGMIPASGGLARSISAQGTLVAAANGDALSGVVVNPAFTPGALTGLLYRGLTLSAWSTAAATSPADPIMLNIGVLTGTGATNAYGILIAPPTGATNNYLIAHTTAATFNVLASGAITTASTILAGTSISIGSATSGSPFFASLGTGGNMAVFTNLVDSSLALGITASGAGTKYAYIWPTTNTGLQLGTGSTANLTFAFGGAAVFSSTLGVTGLITASAGVTVAAGQALTLGNAYVAGVQVPSGYVVIKDSAGTSYKVSVNL